VALGTLALAKAVVFETLFNARFMFEALDWSVGASTAGNWARVIPPQTQTQMRFSQNGQNQPNDVDGTTTTCMHPRHRITREHFVHVNHKPLLLNYLRNLRPVIQRLTLYQHGPAPYRQGIDFLHQLIICKKNWFPKCTMKQAWGLDSGLTPATIPGPPGRLLPQMTLKRVWRDA
jgi:hypothetical protein